MTITEFLTARLDEDEEQARSDIDHFGGTLDPRDMWIVKLAHRALADVAAKRAIVENLNGVRLEQPAIRMYREGLAEVTLRMLALPYADHVDYDEAWRVA